MCILIIYDCVTQFVYVCEFICANVSMHEYLGACTFETTKRRIPCYQRVIHYNSFSKARGLNLRRDGKGWMPSSWLMIVNVQVVLVTYVDISSIGMRHVSMYKQWIRDMNYSWQCFERCVCLWQPKSSWKKVKICIKVVKMFESVHVSCKSL